MRHRLILIEGLFGSGKSTAAERLGNLLTQRGVQCRAFHEFADDHPIPIDTARIEDLVCAPDLLDRIEAAFLEADLNGTGSVVIMESRIWQYAAMFPLLADVPVERIECLLRTMNDHLRAADPALIYFHHSDPEASFARTIAEPDRAEWLAWVTELAERLPWQRNRGLRGVAGWTAFATHWATQLPGFYAEVPFAKMRLVDAHHDWEQSDAAIDGFLGLLHASTPRGG